MKLAYTCTLNRKCVVECNAGKKMQELFRKSSRSTEDWFGNSWTTGPIN